jgi:hypothetical protein
MVRSEALGPVRDARASQDRTAAASAASSTLVPAPAATPPGTFRLATVREGGA